MLTIAGGNVNFLQLPRINLGNIYVRVNIFRNISLINYFDLNTEPKNRRNYCKKTKCTKVLPKNQRDTPVGGNRVPESVASSLLHPATLRAPDVHGKSAPFRA